MFECLFQCDNKEHFIERIKGMDLEVQKSLVEYIQQVIDFLSFHYNHHSVCLVLYFKINVTNGQTPFISGHHRNYRK